MFSWFMLNLNSQIFYWQKWYGSLLEVNSLLNQKYKRGMPQPIARKTVVPFVIISVIFHLNLRDLIKMGVFKVIIARLAGYIGA